MQIVTRTAVDANARDGCSICPRNRDRFSGWGVLDVTAAVARALSGGTPARDTLEPNDDAGAQAQTVPGEKTTIRATVDYWDDQSDVYRIRLFPGQRLFASLGHGAGARILLFRPKTRTLEGLTPQLVNQRVGRSARRGANQLLGYRVPARHGGFYYLQVKLEAKTAQEYSLTVVKSKRS